MLLNLLPYIIILITILLTAIPIAWSVTSKDPIWIFFAPIVIIAGVIGLLMSLDAKEMDTLSERTKVENIGFNYLHHGIKEDTNEICLYHDRGVGGGQFALDVIYCERNG